MLKTKDRGPRLSEILAGLAADETRERVSLRDIFDAMGDRAFGALMLVFALPNVLPTPPGTSAILGLPLVILTLQLMLGQSPWLPNIIAARSMARADFAATVGRMAPWLAKAEKMLKPRLSSLVGATAERVIGTICFIMAVVLLLPIPLGNMAPAFVICLFALAILEKDGVFALAGLVAAIASSVLIVGFYIGVIKAFLYFLSRALH